MTSVCLSVWYSFYFKDGNYFSPVWKKSFLNDSYFLNSVECKNASVYIFNHWIVDSYINEQEKTQLGGGFITKEDTVNPIIMLVMLIQTTVFSLYAKLSAPNIFHILFPWLQTLKKAFFNKKMNSVEFICCNFLLWLVLNFSYTVLCTEITLSKSLYHARNRKPTFPKKNIRSLHSLTFWLYPTKTSVYPKLRTTDLEIVVLWFDLYTTQQVGEVYLS